MNDCDGPPSREHYISRSVIGTGQVTVSGLPAFGGIPKRIPSERLVAKMLCKHHNEALSPLDQEAGRFFQVLKAFKIRGIKRARGARKPGGIDTYQIDGALVERWMLKTLINFAFRRHLDPDMTWSPEKLWVEIAFGLSAFPERSGLYLLNGEVGMIESDESSLGLRFLTLTRGQTTDLIGGQFRMEDIQFALAMEPLHESQAGGYRVRVLKDKSSLNVRQVINFDWRKAAPIST